MTNPRILIPWDELTESQQQTWLEGGQSYDELYEAYTLPLRMRDEWTDAEREEHRREVRAGFSIEGGVDKALEIATRPPKPSAVEEMDRWIATMRPDDDIDSTELREQWQAVKKEKGI